MEMGIKESKKNVGCGFSGSFTVELACLFPLILLIIFGIWSLSFYMHHKVWLTAAAYEAASVGTAEGIFEDEKAVSAAQVRARERMEDFFEGNLENKLQVNKVGDEIQVIYLGEVQALYGGMKWKFQARGKSCLCRPVDFIRKVHLAEKVKDAFGR